MYKDWLYKDVALVQGHLLGARVKFTSPLNSANHSPLKRLPGKFSVENLSENVHLFLSLPGK